MRRLSYVKPALVIMATGTMLLLSASACAANSTISSSKSNDATAISSTQDSATSDPVFDAAAWSTLYPNECRSYECAAVATYGQDDEHGKLNAFWDAATTDEYPLSVGCLRCHTSQFGSLMDEKGDGLLAMDFASAASEVDVGVTCYSCHGNDPTQLQVANTWIVDAAKEGGITTDEGNLVCAQCHSAPDWSNILTNPDPSTWSTLQAGMDPEAQWAYYAAEGYEDPTCLSQEIEFNNYYGSIMYEAGATCKDCHMPKVSDAQGNTFTQHQWQGVDDNEALYQNCLTCHTDSTVEERKAAVEQVQADFLSRHDAAQAVVDRLADAVDMQKAVGSPNDDDLTQATTLLHKATFFMNYGTDVSDGFHSMGDSAVAGCFDLAIAAANEGLAMFG